MSVRESKNRVISQANRLKAYLLSQLTLLGAFSLLVGSFYFIQLTQAVTNESNFTATVSAGALTIDQVANNVAFNSGGAGDTIIATIGNNDSSDPARTKITATSAGAWTLSGYFNTNFVKTDNAAVQMTMADRMAWYPTTEMVIENITNDSAGANIAAGADANFAGIASGNKLTQARNSDSEEARGKFGFSNLKFNYTIPITAESGDYSAAMVVELI